MTRIDEIVTVLKRASHYYYNLNSSILSDEEFDSLKDELKSLSPNHPFLNQIGSKIQTTEWKKETHDIAMNSLNKVNTIDEFKKWTTEVNEHIFLLMEKLDGISINLVYENGNLVKAITRGDGSVGENIFSNVIKMKGIVTYILNFNGSIRGEIILKASDFEKINEIARNNKEKEFSNSRNAASGIAKRFDGKYSEFLSVIVYDVTGNFEQENQKIDSLKTIFGEEYVCSASLVNVPTAIEIWENYIETTRASLDYEIDGLVLRVNNIARHDEIGNLGENPKWSIAWKFPAIRVKTKIESIEWSLGNSNRITPVANLSPVRVAGVTVKRASLHNIEIFEEFNLHEGDIVEITRNNDVIPQIRSNISDKENQIVRGKKFDVQGLCPVCSTITEIDGKYLICPNEDCRGKILGNLFRWCYALEIMDISDKTLEKMIDIGIQTPADLYKKTKEEYLKVESFGEKSVKKFQDQLIAKNEIDLDIFIDALNIPHFSQSRALALIDAGIDSIGKMMSATKEELIKIEGIQEKTADRIINGLSAKAEIIQDLFSVGIKIKKIIKVEAKTNMLNGKSFCFTGGIQRIDSNGKRFTREMMWNLVRENGGEVLDSVKKGLNYLVQADPNSVSSKSQKAKTLGVELLSEKKFFEMIGM